MNDWGGWVEGGGVGTETCVRPCTFPPATPNPAPLCLPHAMTLDRAPLPHLPLSFQIQPHSPHSLPLWVLPCSPPPPLLLQVLSCSPPPPPPTLWLMPCSSTCHHFGFYPTPPAALSPAPLHPPSSPLHVVGGGGMHLQGMAQGVATAWEVSAGCMVWGVALGCGTGCVGGMWCVLWHEENYSRGSTCWLWPCCMGSGPAVWHRAHAVGMARDQGAWCREWLWHWGAGTSTDCGSVA